MTAVARTGASLARGQSKQDYGTPVDLVRAVVERFGPIAHDLAAHEGNCVVPAYFGRGSPLGEDTFAHDWSKLLGNSWLNPEFDDIAPYAAKCAASRGLRWEGRRILLLTPASVGSQWFDEHVHGHALVLGLVGRLTFLTTPRVDTANPMLPGLCDAPQVVDAEDANDPYPKDCILSVYGEPPGFDTWKWKKASRS